MEALFRYLQDQIYGVCPDAQVVIEAFYDLRREDHFGMMEYSETF